MGLQRDLPPLEVLPTDLAKINGGARLVYVENTQPVGNTVKNTTTETTIASTYVIPAASAKPGDVYYLAGSGVYSTGLVAPTFTGKFKLDGITILDTGALATLLGSITDGGFNYNAKIVVQADGITLDAQGEATFSTGVGASITQVIRNASVISFEPTTPSVLTATCKWSAASNSNSITHRQMMVWKVCA